MIIERVHHGSLCQEELKDKNSYLHAKEKLIMIFHALFIFLYNLTVEIESKINPENYREDN